MTLILRTEFSAGFRDIESARIACLLMNTAGVHVQGGRWAECGRCNDLRGGVWGGDGGGGAKHRKGETKADDAFHEVAPECGEKMGVTLVLELRDEKTL